MVPNGQWLIIGLLEVIEKYPAEWLIVVKSQRTDWEIVTDGQFLTTIIKNASKADE